MDSRSWTTEEVIVLESNATTRLTSALAAVVVLAMALAAAASAAPGATCGWRGPILRTVAHPGEGGVVLEDDPASSAQTAA